MYLMGYNKGMTDMKNTINEYLDAAGKSPYADWLDQLRDAKTKAKIMMRVDKMELGLFGDAEPIGEGLSELRIHYGSGYRVYYGKEGRYLYLLLCGGDKSTQSKDIKKAKAYWKDYKQRNDDET
jgi:putative addiction module killer protein